MSVILTCAVDVTGEDIDRGLRGDCAACPLALAIERAVRAATGATDFVGVLVDEMGVTVQGHTLCDGTLLCANLPAAAGDFVVRFDDGRPVTPLSFPLTFTDDPCPE
jgi:hypothetical protein